MNHVIVIHKAYEDPAEVVAKVLVDDLEGNAALEYAFRSTNNIEDSWIKNENVEYLGEDPDGARSTSVGDLLLLNGDLYEVKKYGFSLVKEKEVVA
ncbi:uncharacterized protein METZ01_LOCUS501553 [marine metagenome]|uniref:Uncharacterized protein n=1 Tax=marine metagenome TaxID=408172 RepID=A0A383DWK7_9ZZZZ